MEEGVDERERCALVSCRKLSLSENRAKDGRCRDALYRIEWIREAGSRTWHSEEHDLLICPFLAGVVVDRDATGRDVFFLFRVGHVAVCVSFE